ncbi:MAG: RagB/SusD family nutrient uptake outer membrane protein [Dysgonamonadaceae bacterium]|jgi:hypothetical protein|nr:RagB/SusD family nutrient uptake outer membrane protein [Dysgonamonadaceae bacterium]
MRKAIYIILSVFILLSIAGCSDWLSEDDAPKLVYDYYETEAGVDAAINAAYSFLRWGCGGERTSILTELGTDLFTAGNDGSHKAAFNAYGSQLNPSYSILENMWANHYKGISNANIAIDRILASDMPEAKKDRSLAEMLFIRSFLYFELVQQFGKIPMVIDGSLDVRTEFKRAPVSDIYNQLISDLQTAESKLPREVSASEKGRATAYAAAHLLSKVYLTRGSAIDYANEMGQQPDDLDKALYYSEKVIKESPHKLLSNFSDLWDINNMGNAEVIFAVQFTNNPVFNGDGNCHHLYWCTMYESFPGMVRDIQNGRPYRRFMPTEKTWIELFDRKNDSRFYKSFRWSFACNNQGTIPKWQPLSDNGVVYFTPDPAKGQVAGNPKFAVGDTALLFSVQKTSFAANSLDMKKLMAEYSYSYVPYEAFTLNYYPILVKHLAPNRPSVAEMASNREFIRMRLGETYLIAAEAAGRKGDFELAAAYINAIRQRAAWHDGEEKMSQYWTVEGGTPNDTHSTFDEIKVTPAQLSSMDFVAFMLDERGRELLGECYRWEDLVRCEKLYEWVKQFNKEAVSIRPYHRLRPIPQSHIDRLKPAGQIEEEQNEGYY